MPPEPEPEVLEIKDAVPGPDEASTDTDLGAMPLRDLSGEELPKVFRAKADTTRKVRQAAAAGVIWAAMAAVFVVAIALVIVFRADMVRAWPKSAAAFAAIGLPVNNLGLVIEGVRAEPSLQEGHAALAVAGMIRNIENHAVIAPPLRITLLNKAGKTLATKIARPADPRVPPGETRHFALAILDPPSTAHDLEISFAPEAAKAHPAPAHDVKSGSLSATAPLAAPPPSGQLRPQAPIPISPPPVEAKPLSSDSPYALEPHG